MKNLRLQSAMEYLMTYGWAILIIAIVIVALFSLGVFNSSQLLPTSCVAVSSGYNCATPVYHSGVLTLLLGQATGTNWVTANIIFIPQGVTVPQASSVSPTTLICNGVTQSTSIDASNTFQSSPNVGILCPNPGGVSSLNTGQRITLTFTTGNAGSIQTPGTTAIGSLEAYFQTQSGGTVYQVQIASVDLKAT